MQKRRPTHERRRQIADAALSILGDAGVHHLTAANLASRVGIADGTIFRHFENKAAIVAAAIERIAELLFDDFPPKDPDPLDRLGRFFVGRVRLVRRRPGILRVALSDRLAEAAGESGAAMVQALQARSMAFVRDCIVEAQEKGLVDSEVSPQVLTFMVTGALRGVALSSEGEADVPSPEACWAGVLRILSPARAGATSSI
jgi:AcrR family transcriptional regulator